jgi:hypothetical protein
MRQYSIGIIPPVYKARLNAWALFLLLIAVCFSTSNTLAQRPSLHEGVLTLPYVLSNQTA